MSLRYGIFLLLFGWSWMAQPAPSAAYEQLLYQALSDCLDSLPELAGSQPVKLVDLTVECPDLSRILAGSTFARQAGLDGTTAVNPVALWELHDLLFRANHLELNTQTLRHENLAQILQDAYLPQPKAKKTLWDIFMTWLRDQLKGSTDLSYLDDILEWLSKHIPLKTISQYMVYGAILILLLSVLGLVAYQLYEARVVPQFDTPLWLKRFRRRRVADVHFDKQVDLRALKTLPVAEQPGAVLTWCVNRLQQIGLLSDVRDRTNRELLESLRNPAVTPLSSAFLYIIEMAEQSVYGGIQPGVNEIATLYERAERFSEDPLVSTVVQQ